MKRLAMLVVLVCFGLFALGCNRRQPKKPGKEKPGVEKKELKDKDMKGDKASRIRPRRPGRTRNEGSREGRR